MNCGKMQEKWVQKGQALVSFPRHKNCKNHPKDEIMLMLAFPVRYVSPRRSQRNVNDVRFYHSDKRKSADL